MTPQERQLIDDLFARLSKVEGSPRDPDAMAAIMQGLQTAPNAIYALVQTVLVQDEALKQAHHRIEELEATDAPQPNQGGGSFLDSMRDAVFGSSQSHGSVPNVPPPSGGSRPVWNSGQVMQQAQSPGHYDQGYGQGPYGQSYGAPQGGPMGGGMMGGPMGGAFGGGGGGSFLGTAAAAAAGVVGGSLLLNSFRGMMGGMGGNRSAFGDTSAITDNRSPWSNQSNSDLARDAGINDIGSSRSQDLSSQDLARQDREQDDEQDRDDNSRAGLFDTGSNDDDHDSDGFDSDGDNDYA